MFSSRPFAQTYQTIRVGVPPTCLPAHGCLSDDPPAYLLAFSHSNPVNCCYPPASYSVLPPMNQCELPTGPRDHVCVSPSRLWTRLSIWWPTSQSCHPLTVHLSVRMLANHPARRTTAFCYASFVLSPIRHPPTFAHYYPPTRLSLSVRSSPCLPTSQPARHLGSHLANAPSTHHTFSPPSTRLHAPLQI